MAHPGPWRYSEAHDKGEPTFFICDALGRRVAICDTRLAAEVLCKISERHVFADASDLARREAARLRGLAQDLKARADEIEKAG